MEGGRGRPPSISLCRGGYNRSVNTVTAAEPESMERAFTWRERFVIWVASWAGFLAIRLIGPTLRFKVTIEEGGPPEPLLVPAVYAFWHRCVFPAAWFFRNRQIGVMTSRSKDGEYIARIIEKFGFVPVRGSSSRGAVRALLGMAKVIEAGQVAAFTIDGPRGPMYVAKPGPVVLARQTEKPIVVFHIALEKAWRLRTWDRFMIPKPFSRAHLVVSRLMHVPPDADSDSRDQYHQQMQDALDRVRVAAEAAFK